MNKKIILVTGATGAQGGAVAKSLLEDGNYRVRILTRNAASENALMLAAAGAEVFQGDLDNKDSLIPALENCYGVFGITNFWEHFQKESQQGRNLIDAVKEAGVSHFVFHSLPNYSQLSRGEFPTPHCDNKAALESYTKSLNIPATFVHTSFYFENFYTFFPLQEDASGNLSFGFPQGDTPLAMTSAEDVGPIVCAVFNHPELYIGRVIGVVAEDKPCSAYAEVMTKVLGRKVTYNYIEHSTFVGFGFDGAQEIANMFEVQRRYIPNRLVHLIESNALNPGIQTFEKWLRANRQKIEAAVLPYSSMALAE